MMFWSVASGTDSIYVKYGQFLIMGAYLRDEFQHQRC